jgi:hypothetical protein
MLWSQVLDHFAEEQNPDPLQSERSDPDHDIPMHECSPCLHGSR